VEIFIHSFKRVNPARTSRRWRDMYHHPVINLKNKELSRDIIHGSFLNWIVVAFLVTFYQFFCVSVGWGECILIQILCMCIFSLAIISTSLISIIATQVFRFPLNSLLTIIFPGFYQRHKLGCVKRKSPREKKERLKNNFNRTGGTPILYFLVRFDRRHTRVVSYLLWYKCQK
jgi:hypothetical protein